MNENYCLYDLELKCIYIMKIQYYYFKVRNCKKQNWEK